MSTSKNGRKVEQGEQSFVDPTTSKTHVVRWKVEESSQGSADPGGSTTVAATGFVALWRAVTYGSRITSFKVVVVGQFVFFLFGWLKAPTYLNPFANALSYWLLWTMTSTGFIRMWNVIHKCDSDSDEEKRFYNWNIFGFILVMLATAFLQSLIVDLWRPHPVSR